MSGMVISVNKDDRRLMVRLVRRVELDVHVACEAVLVVLRPNVEALHLVRQLVEARNLLLVGPSWSPILNIWTRSLCRDFMNWDRLENSKLRSLSSQRSLRVGVRGCPLGGRRRSRRTASALLGYFWVATHVFRILKDFEVTFSRGKLQ